MAAIRNIIFLLMAVTGLLATSSTADNILYSGEVLTAGQGLTSGSYSFTMQSDCNLVLYDSRTAIWSTSTAGAGSKCSLSMQADGNLVLYNDGGTALWASNTVSSNGRYACILQKDRNVVIYGGATWATGTSL